MLRHQATPRDRATADRREQRPSRLSRFPAGSGATRSATIRFTLQPRCDKTQAVTLELLIAGQVARFPEAPLERQVFGTDDARDISDLIRGWCIVHLGATVTGVWLWSVSTGCVAGLDLDDGRQVVVKVYAPDRPAARLATIVSVQAFAADLGLPAPQPVSGPTCLGLGLGTAELPLTAGRKPDLLARPDRKTAADGWFRLSAALEAVAPELIQSSTAARRVVDGLYPEPHSPLFDFEGTSRGAEWIDELARRALEIIRRDDSQPVVAHTDWRSDNLRVSTDGNELTAIYDWDSVRVEPIATALGQVAAMHSIDWTTGNGPYFATAAECVDFARCVERTRPIPFSQHQWEVIRAAIVYGWCCTSRAEHARVSVGDDNPQFHMRDRLRSEGVPLLQPEQ